MNFNLNFWILWISLPDGPTSKRLKEVYFQFILTYSVVWHTDHPHERWANHPRNISGGVAANAGFRMVEGFVVGLLASLFPMKGQFSGTLVYQLCCERVKRCAIIPQCLLSSKSTNDNGKNRPDQGQQVI